MYAIGGGSSFLCMVGMMGLVDGMWRPKLGSVATSPYGRLSELK